MKHRLLSCLLVVTMVLAVAVTGCGSQTPAPAQSQKPAESQKSSAPAQSQPAQSQQPQLKYPEKPVTLIIPFVAGGGTDIGVRIIAKYAEKHLGQPLIIKNVDGGGSEVGVLEMVKSKPDGYTIVGFNSASIILTTMRKASYHPVNDIEPVCLNVSDPRLFAVRADDKRFPDIASYIKYAKDNPDKLTIGDSGVGTSGHLSTEVMNMVAKVKAKPVHFGGAGESKAAFLGGHIDSICQTYGEVKTMMEEGKAKIIAVATEKRMPELPDVPTFKEAGIDLVIASNRGIAAPKGTPKEIVAKIADSFKKAMEDPQCKAEMDKLGLPLKYMGPEEFGKLNQQELDIYTPIGKAITQK